MTRISTWYIIITALFRCPASPEGITETTSRVCAPYLTARSYVDPHVLPYYEKYIAPYQAAVEPHYKYLNKTIYTPALTYGQAVYQKHGAPQVDKAWAYSSSQWNQALKPQLDAYSAQAKQQYDQNLAPHVEKVAPYWENTQKTAQDVYQGQVIPAYEAVQPHVNTAVTQAQKHWNEIGYPAAAWALQSSWNFLDRTVRPRIAILYGENVQPQIDKITQRLGRYSDEQKLKAAVKEFEEPASPEDPEGTHANPAQSIVSSSLANEVTTSQSPATETDEPEAIVPDTEATPDEDLTKWQLSWQKAASHGIDDLRKRVGGISNNAEKTQIDRTGKALLTELENAKVSSADNLKQAILKDIKLVNDEKMAAVDAKAGVSGHARAAGAQVRSKAQAVRDWHQDTVENTHKLVAAAAANTLEVIDGIRDLGLQEIGMKWAALGDKVTYQDWQKYHEVKKDYGETRSSIEAAALEHPDFVKFKAQAEDIEAQAMAIAEDAAKELIRLRDAGSWKIEAGDDTDDFSTRVIPPVAKNIANKMSSAIDQASENVIGTSTGTVESVLSEASNSAESAASKLSEGIVGSEPGVAAKASKSISEAVIGTEEPAITSVVSVVRASASAAAAYVNEAVQDQKPIVDDTVESIKSAASVASASVVGTDTPGYESGANAASSSIKSAMSRASEAVVGSSTPGYEAAASDFAQSAESAASAISNSIIGSSTPVYEASASEVSKSIKSAASAASEAVIGKSTPAYESAASKATEQVVSVAGSVMSAASASSESLQSAASEVVMGKAKPGYESAASRASEAVVGSETPAYESVASSASESAKSAASKASSAAYGETPTHESIISQASKSVKSVASEASSAVIGSDTPVYESAASQISKAAGSSAAAVSGAASSVADSVRSSAASVASQASKSAKKVYGGAMAQEVEYHAPILDDEFDADDYKEKVNSVLNDANSKYNQMTKAVSEALLKPTPTKGSVESLQNVVQDRYASAMAAASQALYGREPTTGEQVVDAVNSRYQDAVNA